MRKIIFIILILLPPQLVLSASTHLSVDEYIKNIDKETLDKISKKPSIEFLREFGFGEGSNENFTWSIVSMWVAAHYIDTHEKQVTPFIFKMFKYNEENRTGGQPDLVYGVSKEISSDKRYEYYLKFERGLLGNLTLVLASYWRLSGETPPELTDEFMKYIFEQQGFVSPKK